MENGAERGNFLFGVARNSRLVGETRAEPDQTPASLKCNQMRLFFPVRLSSHPRDAPDWPASRANASATTHFQIVNLEGLEETAGECRETITMRRDALFDVDFDRHSNAQIGASKT